MNPAGTESIATQRGYLNKTFSTAMRSRSLTPVRTRDVTPTRSTTPKPLRRSVVEVIPDRHLPQPPKQKPRNDPFDMEARAHRGPINKPDDKRPSFWVRTQKETAMLENVMVSNQTKYLRAEVAGYELHNVDALDKGIISVPKVNERDVQTPRRDVKLEQRHAVASKVGTECKATTPRVEPGAIEWVKPNHIDHVNPAAPAYTPRRRDGALASSLKMANKVTAQVRFVSPRSVDATSASQATTAHVAPQQLVERRPAHLDSGSSGGTGGGRGGTMNEREMLQSAIKTTGHRESNPSLQVHRESGRSSHSTPSETLKAALVPAVATA